MQRRVGGISGTVVGTAVKIRRYKKNVSGDIKFGWDGTQITTIDFDNKQYTIVGPPSVKGSPSVISVGFDQYHQNQPNVEFTFDYTQKEKKGKQETGRNKITLKHIHLTSAPNGETINKIFTWLFSKSEEKIEDDELPNTSLTRL